MASTLVWADLELGERLGEGQAGEVWTARLCRGYRDLTAGETVAVKRYKRWVLEQPGQLERIYREFATGVKVDHQNVVRTYCLVVDPQGMPCLVMRYYDGITLESLLQQRREHNETISISDVFMLLRGLAGGVLALHEAGAVHRDIKPANIIVKRSDGTPVLMDLGVVTETVLPEHTRTDRFLGTIRYAHPKYLTGVACNFQSDTYSVGGIAYELFFQTRFLGDEGNWASLVARIVASQAPTSVDIAAQCGRVERLYGRLAAEAVYWTMRALIRVPQPSSLKNLCSAIDTNFWCEPFYDTGHGIEVGIPWSTYWDLSTPDRWPGGTWEWSLALARQTLLERLDTADLPALNAYVGKHYWDWQCLLDDRQITDDRLTEIEADLNHFYGHIVDEESGEVWELEHDLPTFLRAHLRLYRYGLLASDEVLGW